LLTGYASGSYVEWRRNRTAISSNAILATCLGK